MYTVDFFINKFEAIPGHLWTTGLFKSWDNKRCAIGHCLDDKILEKIEVAGAKNGCSLYKPTSIELENEFKESYSLSRLFDFSSPNKGSALVIGINNGDDSRYQQPTPKQRILAALYDIKKMQSPEVKEKIVYVAVPVTITEQAKELVMS